MAVFMELLFPGTAEQYDAVDQALNAEGDPPEGFIAHSARIEGENVHVLDIWESAEAFGAFAQSRLGPTVAQTMGGEAPDMPEPKFTELHNAYGYGAGA